MLSSLWGGIPRPLSRTCSATSDPSAWTVTQIRPLGGVYLEAFVNRFTSTCCSRTASPSTSSGWSSDLHVDHLATLLTQRLHDGDRIGRQFPQIDRLATNLDLALHDARHIEQVVQQKRHLGRLAFNHRQRIV